MAPLNSGVWKQDLCKLRGSCTPQSGTNWLASLDSGFLVHSGAHSQHPAMTSETSESSAVLLIAVLVVVYLAVVVIMVRRQLRQVSRDEEEEEDRVVMTDKKGNTIIHKVESVVNNTKEVLM